MADNKKAKGGPARKKPVEVKPPAPKAISPIILAADAAIALNPTRAGAAAAIAVIEALIVRARKNEEVVKFLNSALKAVKTGGGQDGGDIVEGEDPTIRDKAK